MENIAEFRNFQSIKKEEFVNEKLSTTTTRDQISTELLIKKCYERIEQLRYLNPSTVKLHREEHITYLEKSLKYLTVSYECLDCSRPWLIYWILASAHFLNFKFSGELLDNTVNFLIKCRDPNGGFCGGPGQLPHLAPTYAAVNSLCMIGTEKAYNAVNRETLKQFLMSVREPNGAFRLHYDGEIDVRGAYCAVSCAKLLNFPKKDEEELFENTADWICSCQTYEGGFGGAPDLEAHGGYTFCGLAALVMLGRANECKIEDMLKWLLARQMRLEGGFQGRTNKLVDGCYSFWVGATLPIAQAVLARQDNLLSELLKKPLFDRVALQEYILLCCQSPYGGLMDKPGKNPDIYHTCYTLSGLSIAQHCELSTLPLVLGSPDNEVLPTHPLHNVPPLSVMKCFEYFENINKQNLNDFEINDDFTENDDDTDKFFDLNKKEDISSERATSVETTSAMSEDMTTGNECENDLSSISISDT